MSRVEVKTTSTKCDVCGDSVEEEGGRYLAEWHQFAVRIGGVDRRVDLCGRCGATGCEGLREALHVKSSCLHEERRKGVRFA